MAEPTTEPLSLTRDRFPDLLEAVLARGYRLLGPTLRDGAIVYADLETVRDLPEGLTDEQAPGRYRIARRADAMLFGFAVGPRSFRDFFQAPRQVLVSLRRGENGPTILPASERSKGSAPDARPLALIGARSCDLAGIAVQDRVLMHGAHPDVRYAERRKDTLVIAVHCTEPSGTCFCVSMGSGPRVERDFDLALTELLDAAGHRFIVSVGSERGAEIAAALGLSRAATDDVNAGSARVEAARGRMGRSFEERGVREALLANLEHPAWDAVAERCLACTNCTLVCPTCFCSTTEEGIDVTGSEAERSVRHDSCFNLEHSYVHGGPVRSSVKARYRQWLTHKFATWYDQFGSSGCVGCGRCITACPVGIDVTEEIDKIRGGAHAA